MAVTASPFKLRKWPSKVEMAVTTTSAGVGDTSGAVPEEADAGLGAAASDTTRHAA